MISSEEALASVLSRVLVMSAEEIDLENTFGRVLAEDVFADMDQPPFDRVAMDGIAIHSSRLSFTSSFKIIGTISAGVNPPDLPAENVCFEIMTGAALPEGADMVIRYEDVVIEGGYAQVKPSTKLSTNVHPKGSDYCLGHKVLAKGTIISSPVSSVLASVGKSKVKVRSLPKVTILSTGDELVDIDTIPGPSEIRWSNGISLFHELISHRNCLVKTLKVRDDEERMKKTMIEVFAESDVLILTGGVSAGKFDFVPKLLKECQVKEIFHKVAQRPGKPLWFGETDNGQYVFGLPGNPVSCHVNLRKFVVPFLNQGLGLPVKAPKAFLSEEVKVKHPLTFYQPVKLQFEEGKLMAIPLRGNGSGDFFQLRDSDGFIELKTGEGPFLEGHLSEIYPWGKTYA